MEQIIAFLSRWLTLMVDSIRGGVGSVVALFDWPGRMIGIPGEILAVAVLMVAMLALWRAMGGYFS